MTPEIPADAEAMKALLSYGEYRVWWNRHVNRLEAADPKPDPSTLDAADPELG